MKNRINFNGNLRERSSIMSVGLGEGGADLSGSVFGSRDTVYFSALKQIVEVCFLGELNPESFQVFFTQQI